MPTRTRRPDTGPAPVETAVTDVAVADPSATPAPVVDSAAQTPDGTGAASTDAAGAPADANGKSKKNTAPIQITVPLDLKAQIEARAEAESKTAARWILENIAGDLTYTLAEPTRAASTRGGVKMTDVFGKDLTPAQKKDRLAQAKLLLDGLAAGAINLDDIKAKLGV